MKAIRISHLSLALMAAVFVLGIMLPRGVAADELAPESLQKSFGRPQEKISVPKKLRTGKIEVSATAPEPVQKF